MRRTEASGFLIASLVAFLLLVPLTPVSDRNLARSLATGPEYWGSVETFANVTLGTVGPASFNDVTLINLVDGFGDTIADSAVLDGWLFEMTIADVNGTVLWYEPAGPSERTDDWNLSLEITKTKEDSSYAAVNLSEPAGRQAMVVYLCNETDDIQAGVMLVTGSPLSESIQVYDPIGMFWTYVSEDMWPAFPHDSDTYGLRPDRYFVSFAHSNNTQEITVTVTNSGAGVVYSGNVTVPSSANILWPKLRLDLDVDTGMISIYTIATGWIVDNLMLRSMQSRHAITEPVYEFVEASDPVWVMVTDISGEVISDASVIIEGVPASFNAASSRYEAALPRPVDWDVRYNYTVVADGIYISDSVAVTTLMDSVYGVEIPRWWNGWDWVSVFGRDDSTAATSAETTYALFDHPTTSYLMTGFTGSSSDLLQNQSEIALHYPHDYKTWGQTPWTESVISAEAGHTMLEDTYDYASRWDNPDYVGTGDTYISMANPGNTASWEMMYAQFLSGTRVMGTSSWTYLAGNNSLIGSYWIDLPAGSGIPSWASWHPHQKADLMDMLRRVNTDVDSPAQLPLIRMTAENQGVVRFYNHNIVANDSLLQWVTMPKTNFAYENWKATDGEVASYINGRWTTEVKVNASSSEDVWVYDVSRGDPIASGYWRVPVTVSFDIKDKDVASVKVVCGEWDLNSSNGTFNDLSGGREMDIGYDIRGDKLYVSYFWNESSQIEVKLNQLHNPRITSEGVAQGYAYVDYSSVINCTAPDNGSTLWSLETDASWLTIGSSNDTSCNVTGLSSDWGVYYANLTASDGNDTVYLNWSITITRMKVVSGHVLNETNGPIAGLLVTVTIRDGSVDRTLKVNTTDSNGFYTVTFINDEWFVDDTIIVGAYYSNRSEENATLATTELEQEVNLQFIPIIPEFGALKMALVVCSVGVLVAAVAHYWRRRRSLKSV